MAATSRQQCVDATDQFIDFGIESGIVKPSSHRSLSSIAIFESKSSKS
jgi:hypothetical protein